MTTALERMHQLWLELDRDERHAHRAWVLKHCATCGRAGASNGFWCDACCDEGIEETSQAKVAGSLSPWSRYG